MRRPPPPSTKPNSHSPEILNLCDAGKEKSFLLLFIPAFIDSIKGLIVSLSSLLLLKYRANALENSTKLRCFVLFKLYLEKISIIIATSSRVVTLYATSSGFLSTVTLPKPKLLLT